MDKTEEEIDELWDYSDPQGTEDKFRKLLSNLDRNSNLDLYNQIKTQISRTLGLQGKFDEGHTIRTSRKI
jgi:hypothetical protein